MAQRPKRRYERPSLSISRVATDLPRVVVVESRRYVAEIIRLLLGDAAEIVAETSFGRAATALAELFNPEVMIMGETFADGVVESILPSLQARGIPVIVLTSRRTTDRELRLVSLGAIGVIDESDSALEFAQAIREVIQGGAVLSAGATGLMIDQWRSATVGRSTADIATLTLRENEVIDAMAGGLSSKAIAAALGISVKTVESHKTRIYGKLGVRTQAAAVARALERLDEGTQPARDTA